MIYRTVLLTHILEKYADDTHSTFASNNVAHLDHLEEDMNDDLTKITEWLTASKLTLHDS